MIVLSYSHNYFSHCRPAVASECFSVTAHCSNPNENDCTIYSLLLFNSEVKNQHLDKNERRSLLEITSSTSGSLRNKVCEQSRLHTYLLFSFSGAQPLLPRLVFLGILSWGYKQIRYFNLSSLQIIHNVHGTSCYHSFKQCKTQSDKPGRTTDMSG